MGHSSRETTTQQGTSTVTPDPLTQQWRQDLFGRAGNYLNQGPPQAYGGNWVADPSQATQGGWAQLMQYFSGGVPNLEGANNAIGQIFGQNNPALAMARRNANQNTTWGVNTLRNWANPNNINPYLRSMYQAAAAPVMDDVNSQFVGGGRFGPSAAYGAGMTRGLGELSANIYGQGYEQAANRSMAASQALSGIQQNDRARQLSATGLYGQLFGQQNQQRMDAAGLMPSLYALGAAPGMGLTNVGLQQDAHNQDVIDAERQKWDFGQNAGWDRLMQYASMMSGMPYFTTTNTTGSGTTKNRSSGFSMGWSPSGGFNFGIG